MADEYELTINFKVFGLTWQGIEPKISQRSRHRENKNQMCFIIRNNFIKYIIYILKSLASLKKTLNCVHYVKWNVLKLGK